MSIASEFAEIAATTLNQEPDVGETLDGIVHYACASFDSDHVGIHIVRGGDITTAASTGAVIEQADKMQVALREGPCLQTVWSHGSLVAEDTATDPRWRKFGPAAPDLGLLQHP